MVRTIYYIGAELKSSYYISHHGILGQKWGVRRYQNKDGSLTEVGKKKLQKDSKSFNSLKKKVDRREIKYDKAQLKFKKRAKRVSLTDTGVALKKRAGIKLARKYRSYLRSGEKLANKYSKMVKNYGIDSLSKEQIAIGSEITDRLVRLR